MCGGHDIVTRDTFLSRYAFGAVFGLGLLCHAQAQTPGPAADYQATSAIEADDDMALPDERAIEATAAIPAVATGQDAASAMASVPTTLIGRWTIKSVRTKDNILKKVQKLLLNPAVLTLRQDGQFTMTAGCAHNTGTIRWSEEQFFPWYGVARGTQMQSCPARAGRADP